MNLTRIKAIARKEFIQVWRDPRSLGLAIALPMVMLVLFGYALTLDVDNVPMVVWDQDQSPASQEYILNFSQSPYFKIIGYSDNYNDLYRHIDRNRAIMALVIPPDFAGQLASDRAAPVQLLVDGSDSNTATIALGYASAVTALHNRKLVTDRLAGLGVKSILPVDMRSRVWFNQDLKSRNFIIPGLIAVIMMVIAALLTSLTVAREWERGTMEQLISTPIKPRELVIGKIIPYFAIGLVDVLIAVLMGEFIFDVPLNGSVILLFALSSLFLVGVLGLGILISIVTKKQLLASQLALVSTFLPAFLLSGFVFSIANMPTVIRAVTYVIPARYFVTILKGIYLKGIGLEVLGIEALLLCLFTLAVLNLAVMMFRKRVV
ncbi:MAG: ABC transporter permease [Candidatus Brocadiia bacterium]